MSQDTNPTTEPLQLTLLRAEVERLRKELDGATRILAATVVRAGGEVIVTDAAMLEDYDIATHHEDGVMRVRAAVKPPPPCFQAVPKAFL